MDVAAVVVGDELLAGHVHDANTHFIAGRVSALGHRLRRAVLVGDDPEAIAEEIRRERAGGAALVFVCGGVGSTHDDRTMEGVGRALDRPLAPCEPLAAVIEGWLRDASDAGFGEDAFGADAMRKMALAPEGAVLLECSARLIPAVTIEEDGFAVVVLPGPPPQLEMVFREAVEPRYLAGTGATVHREELSHPFPESTLALALEALQREYPATSIGSYPQRTHTLIRIAGPESDVKAALAGLQAHIQTLTTSDEGRRFLGYLRERLRR